MKTVTFVSHYFCTEMKIRLTDDKYKMLFNDEYYTPLQLYFQDVDRVSYRLPPVIFSLGQIKKLDKFLLGTLLWDKII